MGAYEGRHALIFAAAPETEYGYIRAFLAAHPDALIACADGGLRHARALGLHPDFMISDCDSLPEVEGTEIIRLKPEKDDTDMMLAVKYGLENGCGSFLIHGGLGGRLSHTMANLQVLRFLCQRGCRGLLIDGGSIVTMIQNERLCFAQTCEGMLSVFAQGGAALGVSIRGLKYPLEDGTLMPDYPLGTSNEFCGEDAQVEVRDGALLLVWESTQSDFSLMRWQTL